MVVEVSIGSILITRNHRACIECKFYMHSLGYVILSHLVPRMSDCIRHNYLHALRIHSALTLPRTSIRSTFSPLQPLNVKFASYHINLRLEPRRYCYALATIYRLQWQWRNWGSSNVGSAHEKRDMNVSYAGDRDKNSTRLLGDRMASMPLFTCNSLSFPVAVPLSQ